MTKQIQKGFTLIELMIVVAIIGILAAIAIPQYGDYIARTQASEAIMLMGGMKTPIEEDIYQTGKFPSDFEGTNLDQVNTSGTYVASVAPTAIGTNGAGYLTATFKTSENGANTRIAGKIVHLERSVAGAWKCNTGDDEDTQVGLAYVPASCVAVALSTAS